ncbi:MAG: 50S ribosomal protein L17 [Cyclobacteriaceae bacterium]|nr:50S ribosomal protein L17 [Cyclobacteriaceae bacterium]
MRHGNKVNHLGRTASHRKAMLSNMASSLIMNKRLTTTVAKAKALRRYVEPIITRAKNDTQHSRRMVFSYLQDKESVKTLFGEVASKVGERPGGYTRIIKLGQARLGDSAEMCLIELVDFNELYTKEGTTKKAKTRRSRRGGKKATAAAAEETVAESTEATEAEEAAEEKPAKKPARKTAAKKTATRKKKKEE